MIKRFDNVSVKKLTTFGIDAKAAALVTYDDSADLEVIANDNTLPRPYFALGGGSNLLFENDFKGTLLHSAVNYIRPVSQPTAYGLQLVKVGAGVRLDYLCQWAADNRLWGLENLSGIPGDVGGATVQNVGAYGVEFGESVHAVRLFDLTEQRFITTSGAECEYGYRTSIFKDADLAGRLIVTEVTLALSHEARPKLEYGNLASHFNSAVVPSAADVRREILAIRESKLPDPAKVGSAGSFFKNPVVTPDVAERIAAQHADMPRYDAPDNKIKLSAAWLIDKAGLKGQAIGGASVWKTQPLVIVNTDGTATADDVLALEAMIINAVNDMFGITLTPEVQHIN